MIYLCLLTQIKKRKKYMKKLQRNFYNTYGTNIDK